MKFIGFVLILHSALALPNPTPYPVKSMELFFIGPDKEYYISAETADLHTASFTCSQLSKTNSPMSLLAIEDEKEYTKILWHLMRVENVQGIWTSGYYSAYNKTFTWTSTQKAMAYTNFGGAAAAKPKPRRAARSSKCAMECLTKMARAPRAFNLLTEIAKPVKPKIKKCDSAFCEAEPCEPLEMLPCNTTRPDCTVKCTPPCKTFRPPCSVKCAPCKIYTPPCTVREIACHVEAANCTTDREPCQVTTLPCETIRPPCKTEQPNCIITTPPPCTVPTTTRTPCLPVACEETQPPCIVTMVPCTSSSGLCKETKCPPATTTCKPNTCAPPVICQSPAIICPAPITHCPPPVTTCPEPEIYCPEPETTCPEAKAICDEPVYDCPAPIIECPSPIVSCPSPVTICDQPEVDCPKPTVDCPPITPVCPPPKKCVFGPPCNETTTIPTTSTTEITITTTTASPCDCVETNEVVTAPALPRPNKSGYIVLNSDYSFKWDVEPSPKKAYHFICEGNK